MCRLQRVLGTCLLWKTLSGTTKLHSYVMWPRTRLVRYSLRFCTRKVIGLYKRQLGHDRNTYSANSTIRSKTFASPPFRISPKTFSSKITISADRIYSRHFKTSDIAPQPGQVESVVDQKNLCVTK